MFVLDDLSVRYRTLAGRVHALSRVSLTAPRGSTLAIVGESGSGKSTIALAAMGLLPPEADVTGGRILIDGQDLYALSVEQRRQLRGKRIGLVFQDPFSVLNPSLTIGDQVSEGLIYHLGMSRGDASRRAVELLDEVGILRPEIVARAYPHELSGGMRQRALLAGALAAEPDLLVLDEPTTALDVTVESQILDLLEQLQRSRGLTMVFISHNLGVVRRIASHVAVLYAGEVIECGKTRDVLLHPVHPYTKGLLAAIPTIDRRKKRLASIPGQLPDLRAARVGCGFRPRCPFSVDRCRTPQPLEAVEDERLVRCHRAHPLESTAWPPFAAPSGTAAREPLADRNIVTVSDLSKTFSQSTGKIRLRGLIPRMELTEHHAVDGVSLNVRPGEVLGLVGESGSGKTTLGRTILRLLEPTSGTIEIDGQTVSGVAQRDLDRMRRCAQIVFQNPDSSLNPRKTVRELLGRPLARFGLASRAEIPGRVDALLELVRLPVHYADRYPHQMSGGEKQRVGIACALATEPRFIVCDEPVSALDVSVQAAIVNLLADLRDRLGVAYLFISHDISVVAHLADRIAVLQHGKIVEIGDTASIIEHPSHPYTIKLISSVPRIDAA